MEQKRHVTQCHVMMPWFSWGMFFLLWFLYSVFVGHFGDDIPLLDGDLSKLIGALVCGLTVFFAHHLLLDGDIVLTDRGVEVQSRIRRSCAWKNCAQVIAMRYDGRRVLVVLKSGGFPMKEGKNSFGFFLRNPGKLIFLPDDQFTRAFVETYYGKPDIVRSE